MKIILSETLVKRMKSNDYINTPILKVLIIKDYIMKKSEIKIRFQEYIATKYTSEATLKTYDNIAHNY